MVIINYNSSMTTTLFGWTFLHNKLYHSRRDTKSRVGGKKEVLPWNCNLLKGQRFIVVQAICADFKNNCSKCVNMLGVSSRMI